MKNLYKIITLGLSLFSIAKASDFKDITTWQDVKPFAGQYVIFTIKPENSYFAYQKDMIELEPGLYAARISDIPSRWSGFAGPLRGEEGYGMDTLQKFESVPSANALVDTELRKVIKLNMRLASTAEKLAIRDLLESNAARLGYSTVMY